MSRLAPPLRYDRLPEQLRGGMQRYIEHGIAPGDFLRAVLSNDLAEACRRADDIHRYCLFDIVRWLYNDAPSSCWGTPEIYGNWIIRQAKR